MPEGTDLEAGDQKSNEIEDVEHVSESSDQIGMQKTQSCHTVSD